MDQLLDRPLVLFVVSFLLMSIAAWTGAVWLRRKKPLDPESREDFAVVQSATLTLLALVIGFTFSMAVGRFDQRKNYEEEEANAIGTEYVRADLLPGDAPARVRALLSAYLQQRIAFYQVRDTGELDSVNTSTSVLQTQLWSSVRSAASVQPTPVTALAVAGMNDVLNTQGYTQASWWNRIPVAAWSLMLVIGAFGNLLVGFGSHSKSVKKTFLFVMPMTVSLSFALIADIDSPRGGMIRVKPLNLISLSQSLSVAPR